MPRAARPFFCLLAAAVVAACGGGKSNSDTAAVTPPARGQLIGSPVRLSTVTIPVLLVELSAVTGTEALTLGGAIACDVAAYHIDHSTVGGASEATAASAALMVPVGLDSSCRGSRPILLYAHGTTTDKTFNMADLQDQKRAEALFMAFFAAQGYIVVAPDYAGYDTSTLPYHPYLVADPQSKDMIDALTAARSALPLDAAPLTRDGGRLFITGYSQGGYVAMATHRAMPAAGMTVTASAPMSGPYALAAFVDAEFERRVSGGAPISSVQLFTAYQKSYGNIYRDVSAVFEAQYASGIESLLPTKLLRSDLYARGLLPQSALFNATPPDPGYAEITPATTPPALAPVFAIGFGSGNLITNSYRRSYLLDAIVHPVGTWPNTTTGVPAAAPTLPVRQALTRNDLRDWSPNSPVLLCGGNADPTVFWLNTQAMQGYWAAHAPAAARIGVLDVDSAARADDPYATVKQDFAAAKKLLALGGETALAEAYHATLVAPFCLAAVEAFSAAQ